MFTITSLISEPICGETRYSKPPHNVDQLL